MVNAFCPQCGKSQATSELCSDCSGKKTELIYETPLIQVSEFDREFYKGSWHRFYDIEEVIVKRVQEALGQEVPIEIPSFEFIPRPKEKIKFEVTALIDGEEVFLPVKLSYMQCDFGQKQKTTYFEGAMQLRDPPEKVFEFIDKEMIELAPKGVFITKTVEQKNGVDLYYTNKTQMQLLAQKIGAKFGAQVSMHPQLFTRNHLTSKDVYRLNVLVTFPQFTVGDVVSFEYPRKGNLLVLIKSMGKITQAYDLEHDKVIGFEIKNGQDFVMHPIKETTISSVHPTIGVLHPETFQEEVPRNANLYELQVGAKVRVAITPKGLYLVD